MLRASREEDQVDSELQEIQAVDEQEGGGLSDLLAGCVRPALLVAIGPAVFQQLIGINTIIYFAPTTLTEAGYGNSGAIYANIAIGVLNALATLLAIRVIDRLGRKPLLLGAWSGWWRASPSWASAPPPWPRRTRPATRWRSSRSPAWPGSSYAATWGPVVWVMLPLSVRGVAMGVAICLHWAANFAVSQTFPVLLDSFGPGPVFLGYAAIGVCAFVFVSLCVRETKGRSLEEIEDDLHDEAAAPA